MNKEFKSKSMCTPR